MVNGVSPQLGYAAQLFGPTPAYMLLWIYFLDVINIYISTLWVNDPP